MTSRLVRIAGLSGKGSDFTVIHDYGELTFRWHTIGRIMAVKLKSQEKEEIPLLFISLDGEESLYYIDGTKISRKLFNLSATQCFKAEKADRVPLSAQSKESIESTFIAVAREICASAGEASIDRPLLECLKGSTFFLPAFRTMKEVLEYCRHIIESPPTERPPHLLNEESHDRDLDAASTPTTERAEWTPGTILEERLVIEEVIRGGMGVVYIAFDFNDVRFYALKTFQEKFLWNELVIKQFVKEAEIWIKLERHPNIVKAELVRIIEGKPYIFLEYVNGTDLEKLLADHSPPIRETIDLAIQFCEGMHYAYKKLSLVHRDIKPSNIFITREGLVKITDFGLGKIFDDRVAEQAREVLHDKHHEGKSASSSSGLAGTLPFMAPEIFSSPGAASVLSDIYSFGIVLYMMLLGKNPFYNDDPTEVIQNHLSLVPPIPHLANADIPESLGSLAMECLKKDPDDRPRDFGELRDRLKKIYREFSGTPYDRSHGDYSLTEEDWLNKGISLASIGHHSEAVITFSQALHLNPQSVQAFIEKGISIWRLGKPRVALLSFDDALSLDPRNTRALYFRGLVLEGLEEFEEALAAFEMALAFDPSNGRVLGSKGKLLSSLGRFNDALACLNQALALDEKIEEAWLDKGKVLLKLKRLEVASVCFLRALEINPRLQPAWHYRGEVLSELGFYSDAIEAYETALTLDRTSCDEYLGLGRCHMEAGNAEKALQAFEMAIHCDAERSDVYRAKARLLEEQGQVEESLRCLLKGRARGGGLTLPLARIHFKLRAFDRAMALIAGPAGTDEEWEWERLKASTRFWLCEKKKIIDDIAEVKPLDMEDIYRSLSTFLSTFCSIEEGMQHLQEIETDVKKCLLLAQIKEIAGPLDEALGIAMKALQVDGSTAEATSVIEDITKRMSESSRKAAEKKGLRGVFQKREAQVQLNDRQWMTQGMIEFVNNRHQEAIEAFQEALSLNPDLHACWFFAALALAGQGNDEKSAECFENFHRLVPDSPGYLRHRIETSGETAAVGELELLYHRWIGLVPRSPHAWLSYLRFLAERGHMEKARLLAMEIECRYSRTWWLSKRSAMYWNIRGFLELLLKNTTRALRFFERGLALDASNPLSMLGSGKCHESLGAREKAFMCYEKLMADGSATLTGMYEKADLFRTGGMKDEALHTIEETLRRKGSSLPLQSRKAQILLHFKDLRSFFAYFTTIYNLNPGFSCLYISRARALVQEGQAEEAFAYMKGAAAAKPDYAPYSAILGELTLNDGKGEKALEFFDRAISLAPLHREARLGRALCLFLHKRHQEALEAFETYGLLFPCDPSLFIYKGAVHGCLEDYQKADFYFLKAIDGISRCAAAWANRGVLKCRLEKPLEALNHAERALRIERENVCAWLVRGTARKKMEDHREACRYFERALSYSPMNYYGWLQRGILEFSLKDLKTSQESFSKACEIRKDPGALYNSGLVALKLEDLKDAERCFNEARDMDRSNFYAALGYAFLAGQRGDVEARIDALSIARERDPQRYALWETRGGLRINDIESLPVYDEMPVPFEIPPDREKEPLEPLSPLHLIELDNNF
jgi:tetratricopeptide (TPR) repeat protein/tRNA A-37 threonylcarbamoyl transferase component Bud32